MLPPVWAMDWTAGAAGLCCLFSGLLFVAEHAGHRVQVLTTTGVALQGVPMNTPCGGICVDAFRVVVCDAFSGGIRERDSDPGNRLFYLKFQPPRTVAPA